MGQAYFDLTNSGVRSFPTILSFFPKPVLARQDKIRSMICNPLMLVLLLINSKEIRLDMVDLNNLVVL